MVSNKIYDFTSDHKKVLLKLMINFKKDDPIIHSIKVSWLNGMMKKTNYDEHERNMLNKMVKKYNERLV
jgi:hypothetical protein